MIDRNRGIGASSASVLGFVASECAGMRLARGIRRKRLDRVFRAEADLVRCIELRGEPLLTGSAALLLGVERQFRSVGAVGRVAPPEMLLDVLPAYLAEPEWHGQDDDDRTLRIRLAVDLAAALTRLPHLAGVDLTRGLNELQAATRAARQRLRQEQLQRRLAQMDPVLRAEVQAAIVARPTKRSAPRRTRW